MKNIDIKLLPISSPICQALIQEQIAFQKSASLNNLIANCKELLVIRIDRTLVCYGTFDLYDGQIMRMNTLHFRDILKDHTLAQYWLSRYIKRKLEKKCYLNFLIAS
jgi:CII-binding regulator of phage lambda lysogenization HflD